MTNKTSYFRSAGIDEDAPRRYTSEIEEYLSTLEIEVALRPSLGGALSAARDQRGRGARSVRFFVKKKYIDEGPIICESGWNYISRANPTLSELISAKKWNTSKDQRKRREEQCQINFEYHARINKQMINERNRSPRERGTKRNREVPGRPSGDPKAGGHKHFPRTYFHKLILAKTRYKYPRTRRAAPPRTAPPLAHATFCIPLAIAVISTLRRPPGKSRNAARLPAGEKFQITPYSFPNAHQKKSRVRQSPVIRRRRGGGAAGANKGRPRATSGIKSFYQTNQQLSY
ncbi:hypothetical protein EVAR_69353_1 [Eumeta japonica]|uniref:Uncharacterized protein n=1 Tax=Eumeta variegata TaxID=151549 RepID=A0A4C1ZWX3_EUMVA|nr:hypothetical protein EVAR_69353_1 [Eumeta japonica]